MPEYHVEESGPDHQKSFRATVRVGGRVYGSGQGRSKKEAEQQAAEAAWNAISNGESRAGNAGPAGLPRGTRRRPGGAAAPGRAATAEPSPGTGRARATRGRGCPPGPGAARRRPDDPSVEVLHPRAVRGTRPAGMTSRRPPAGLVVTGGPAARQVPVAAGGTGLARIGRRGCPAGPSGHERAVAAQRAGRARLAARPGQVHVHRRRPGTAVHRPAHVRAHLLDRGGAALPAPIAHIAPDPLEAAFDEGAVLDRLRTRQTGIKRALLDQSLISGVGNIYADEALWRAKAALGQATSSLRRADAAGCSRRCARSWTRHWPRAAPRSTACT